MRDLRWNSHVLEGDRDEASPPKEIAVEGIHCQGFAITNHTTGHFDTVRLRHHVSQSGVLGIQPQDLWQFWIVCRGAEGCEKDKKQQQQQQRGGGAGAKRTSLSQIPNTVVIFSDKTRRFVYVCFCFETSRSVPFSYGRMCGASSYLMRDNIGGS